MPTSNGFSYIAVFRQIRNITIGKVYSERVVKQDRHTEGGQGSWVFLINFIEFSGLNRYVHLILMRMKKYLPFV